MSQLSIWLSMPIICCGGIVWLRAAAADLMPSTTSSSALCFTSTPLPLAMTGSPNNDAMVVAAGGLVSTAVGAALVDAGLAAANAEQVPTISAVSAAGKISFILFFMLSFDWFGSSSVQIKFTRLPLLHC